MANIISTFFILLTNIIISLYFVNGSADLGVNLGSKAAGKLATHCLNYALRQPRQLKLNLQTGVTPYFNKIAHVSSKTKLSLNNFTVNFDNDMVELSLYDVILKSTSEINLLPLPFLFGEDTAHLHAEIPRATLKLDVRDFDVKLHECILETTRLDVSLDRAILFNLFIAPLHHLLPQSMIEESLCSSIADSLSVFENRFGLEIGLSQVVPEKFQQYLAWPNSTLIAQLATAQARDEQLSLRVAVDWNNNQHLVGIGTTEEAITVLDPTTQTTSTPLGIPVTSTSEVLVEENNIEAIQVWSTTELPLKEQQPTLRDAPLLSGANLEISSERITMWVDDQVLNDMFQQFRWDFEWMVEEIPVESPKLPSATREFLSTLCTNCYFLLKVSANGSPHIAAVNESIVLEKSDRIFLKVVNPVRNVTSVFVSFYLTLNIQLAPTIENGIFKTQVDLLDTQIKMERGAFPSSWNFFVQDLVKGMIMDVIWPGLKKEIENLSYSDGVEIPTTCGIEPDTAQLHFEDQRFGASTALQLDDVSLGTCLQQLKSKLPDPSTFFVIKEAR
uniref:Lipid-binding serum glycoprotein C-terminal domain-containing protein n=1 Tax=Panagrolaimus sp. ES5 TaxID=591445 RepID=A0AC34GPB1_9BILA